MFCGHDGGVVHLCRLVDVRVFSAFTNPENDPFGVDLSPESTYLPLLPLRTTYDK
jgi:hypothetical protein